MFCRSPRWAQNATDRRRIALRIAMRAWVASCVAGYSVFCMTFMYFSTVE